MTPGFHTTMVLTQPFTKKVFYTDLSGVSIPLWFLRNSTACKSSTRTMNVRFHTTMVLTQHIPAPPYQDIYIVRFHTTMVLTQLFFPEKGKVYLYEFPYHYGSYATISVRCSTQRVSRFPYHYGSHATVRSGFAYICFYETFPYHYGSHATVHEIQRSGGFYVSFPYHYGSYATSKR